MHFNGFEDTSFSTGSEHDHWVKFMIILIKQIKEKQDNCQHNNKWKHTPGLLYQFHLPKMTMLDEKLYFFQSLPVQHENGVKNQAKSN